MRRLAPIALVLVAVFALGGAIAASAGQAKQPPLGAWKVSGTAGGFTLKKGKGGKVILANFQLRTPATEAANRRRRRCASSAATR